MIASVSIGAAKDDPIDKRFFFLFYSVMGFISIGAAKDDPIEAHNVLLSIHLL